MENQMSERIKLADNICQKLIPEENSAMQIWRDNYGILKMTDKSLPALDVLTCVYNAEKFIGHAIESVMLQSFWNIHLVIVTDPCTDDTINIIKSMAAKYPNITWIENQEHQGIIACFNKGLEYCHNDFIARMDLDDMIHPLRFEKQMDFLDRHPEIGVISCWMQIFNEKFETKNVTYREDFDLQRITMLFYSPISHAGSIFRAKVIQDFGYRDEFKYAEDYDLWYQIMSKYKTAVYPEFLYLYRTHSNQVTNARNLQIIKDSWFRIMTNLFNDLKLKHNDADIYFHMDYAMLEGELKNTSDWMKYHQWMLRIIKANAVSRYFNQDKLIWFIYHNYWQTKFEIFKQKLGFRLVFEQIFSMINPNSLGNKIKYFIQYILKK